MEAPPHTTYAQVTQSILVRIMESLKNIMEQKKVEALSKELDSVKSHKILYHQTYIAAESSDKITKCIEALAKLYSEENINKPPPSSISTDPQFSGIPVVTDEANVEASMKEVLSNVISCVNFARSRL